MPPPQGFKYQYEKPPKEYSERDMRIFRKMHRVNEDDEVQLKIKKELDIMEHRMLLENDTYQPETIENVKTTDIESDEPNILDRDLKFEELNRRFQAHREYSLDILKGNDYKFNTYLRKMNKLANSKFGGIDVEGYRDYLNNLLEFKKIKADYMASRDPLLDDKFDIDHTDHPEGRGFTKFGKSYNYRPDYEYALNVSNKKNNYQELRKVIIGILKDEIEMRREHDAAFDKEAEERRVVNAYKKYKDQDGYSEDFLAHSEVIDQHLKANEVIEDDLHLRRLKLRDKDYLGKYNFLNLLLND